MSNTITIRPSLEEQEWLSEETKRTQQKPGAIVKSLLKRAKATSPDNSALIKKYAGSVKGLPKDLSSKKGFSR